MEQLITNYVVKKTAKYNCYSHVFERDIRYTWVPHQHSKICAHCRKVNHDWTNLHNKYSDIPFLYFRYIYVKLSSKKKSVSDSIIIKKLLN